MNTTTKTTFNDIFKSSFLENTSSFSIIDSLIGIIVAFAVGLFIYMVYKKTFSGVIYSHSFNISLIIMTMATALIIMGISTNIILSLGMVGALSIVRFRTPIKDPMDLVYLFWAVASGILCGAGLIPLAIIGALAIGLVLIFYVNRLTVENPYLLIVKYTNEGIEKNIEEIVSKQVKKYTVKSKSVMGQDLIEITYEVRLKKEKDAQFINSIKRLDSVNSTVMLSYDGNFTA
ncbi:DUF4956 domain-containing protein [Heyndrickxia oleronia]|jgi:uncharacterized membrane protein YhiD involved in acid resistance|uniref:DUF4956 domain-containing protein n=1 Tax=Heyndrickxia oleronia TaxID=38875 RepID=UPI002432F302|nr:DUF4956 domain-containing protein [Heyndrickxia oleronia]MCI1591378.1 DUF4956 domain-containing protein [Heyndrickxia oleronia]MCI1613894.1 DUF4956 domain-containing protein [Heyndrickxia oleronia]MCI1745024.1 DUF4956 domain-containing protein [Heyndrickxia oleronia]MCI1761759.1 DUF4956 domain-containing protein [Heyndrickxia oleronia]